MAYEAIVRQGQIYFVHDIDDAIGLRVQNEQKPSDEETSVSTEGRSEDEGDLEPDKEEGADNTPDEDWQELTAKSIEHFADWIRSSVNHESSPQEAKMFFKTALSPKESALDNAMKAQSFVHNFTATVSTEGDHYDGRYNGKKESVQTFIYVWTACKIDDQMDYYLVRTSVVCNNQQLGYQNQWDDNKYVGPYFKSLTIKSNIDNPSSQSATQVRASDLSPETSTGSTAFSSGKGFSFSGNTGFNASGPTGGASGGFSISKSSSRSIPNISVT